MNCDFCIVRPATLFNIEVPIWIVVSGSQSSKTTMHNLCQICYNITFGTDRDPARFHNEAGQLVEDDNVPDED